MSKISNMERVVTGRNYPSSGPVDSAKMFADMDSDLDSLLRPGRHMDLLEPNQVLIGKQLFVGSSCKNKNRVGAIDGSGVFDVDVEAKIGDRVAVGVRDFDRTVGEGGVGSGTGSEI